MEKYSKIEKIYIKDKRKKELRETLVQLRSQLTYLSAQRCNSPKYRFN